MDKIKNKTALITGAADGLGYKYSEDLLKNGAKSVAILDLPSSNGAVSAATLEKEFGKSRAIFVPCDVSNAVQFEEAVKKVISVFHAIDIFVNNAGIIDEVQWEKMIAINVNGLIRGSYLALDHMSKQYDGKGGSIVNIASITGICDLFTEGPVYTATKHAVIGFSNCIKNLENITGVRVLIMCPGITTTNLFNDMEKKISKYAHIVNKEEYMSKYPHQTVDSVSRAMMDLIQKGKNGAIWVCEREEPAYEISIPIYKELAVSM